MEDLVISLHRTATGYRARLDHTGRAEDAAFAEGPAMAVVRLGAALDNAFLCALLADAEREHARRLALADAPPF